MSWVLQNETLDEDSLCKWFIKNLVPGKKLWVEETGQEKKTPRMCLALGSSKLQCDHPAEHCSINDASEFGPNPGKRAGLSYYTSA